MPDRSAATLYAVRLRLAKLNLAVFETWRLFIAPRCKARSPEQLRCALHEGHPGTHIPRRAGKLDGGYAWGGDYGE